MTLDRKEWMWDLFISHASEDRVAVVVPLVDHLERHEFRSCCSEREFFRLNAKRDCGGNV